MLENHEKMSAVQATSASHAVLDDANLELIAAGFDDDLAHVFAKKMLGDMAAAGFGPKAEDAAELSRNTFIRHTSVSIR